jgi:hypothetical protein
MKRNLIAVIALLGLATSAAFAEPTLELQNDTTVLKMAPEATSYQADTQRPKSQSFINEREDLQPFNP